MQLGLDQAASLRRDEELDGKVSHRSETASLAIASGKGGVGKTFLAVNIALALRDLGRRPLLVDLDWGLANVDVALGLVPLRHVGHVLSGECSLQDALIEHEGLVILPNGCGQSDLTQLEPARRAALIASLGAARQDRDFIVADTHPGIGAFTVDILSRAAATIVVSTPEPTALTDTYALFKVLGETEMSGPVGLVINLAGSADQAHEAARHLDSVAQRFLGRSIPYWGHILEDRAVPRSVRQQRALLAASPRSAASRSVRLIAGTATAVLSQSSPDRTIPVSAPGIAMAGREGRG